MNAIEFNNVWKKFSTGEKFNSLRDAIPNLVKNMLSKTNGTKSLLGKEEFWALQDVSFSVKKGDVIGIMGPNGAGKSTILKLLSRIMVPNSGKIKIDGRLSALIEVTAGFHPDLTGRENVYLNGMMLGMKKKEIDEKFDEIVDFSGIAKFIDTPVKRYSSGMYSRLGFSVAAHMDPETLLIDEVLSVGDSSFQAKCAEKMRELLGSGATIVIVSHNLMLIQSLCKRAILLNQGEVLKDGATDEVLPFYENIIIREREKNIKRKISIADADRVRIKTETLLDITAVSLRDSSGHVRESYYSDDEIELTIQYDAKKRIEQPVFRVDILRSDGILCCSCLSREDDFVIDAIEGKGAVKLNLGKLHLASNIYVIKIFIMDRELIHSYAVRYQDVLKIGVDKTTVTEGAIFVPPIQWKKG